ncbi:aminotransferase class V-fold PLP-dependent enzyme, partial [Candidatus Woesearchaeota archaeon]|nr:aminotransferase class V-fold PLP-dependent enzyme [Candidatus Woesearchaeota archaeon]
MNQIYLDNAATTKPDSQVVQAMLPFFTDEYGNPSSIHSKGRIAKKALDSARSIIANKLNADSQEIIFCSGGTEADNHAILSTIDKLKDKGNHIIT